MYNQKLKINYVMNKMWEVFLLYLKELLFDVKLDEKRGNLIIFLLAWEEWTHFFLPNSARKFKDVKK